MQTSALKVSENFRKMAVRSVLSIILFLITYIILVILGVGVIFLCGLAAYGLIALQVMFVTIMLGLGFVAMGLLIFFFLIKFVFSSPTKVDRSHLMEINKEQQPELFSLIHDIVREVGTTFPKRVYLSSDVNASVFYDSNFWSMFFPVRKNLQIGMGLMNAVSVTELKAILAHEFGHFSQRSMKVGSYVYNVNKVIYNMLYDNDSYGSLLNRWSNMSSYFGVFAKGAILVVRGIQYVLMKVYRVLNLNYMALSREMEFHADAVAASVTGSGPLVTSLLRLELADQSLSIVFDYYNDKITALQKTGNFYPQQQFVIGNIAKNEGLPLKNGLPDVSLDVYRKVKKTKLVLNDQWSSHPSTEERVARLTSLNFPAKNSEGAIAIDLLANRQQLQEQITADLFDKVTYTGQPTSLGIQGFIDDFLSMEEKNAYPGIYNRYFDQRNPYIGFSDADFITQPIATEPSISTEPLAIEEMLDDKTLGQLNALNNANNDKEVLERIAAGTLEVETFDYDGQKYAAADARMLIVFLEKEIDVHEQFLKEKDETFFFQTLNTAIRTGNLQGFKEKSLAYQSVGTRLEIQRSRYAQLAEATSFMHVSTPFDQMPANIKQLKEQEGPFKEEIRYMMDSPLSGDAIDEAMRNRLNEYLLSDWTYFDNNLYFDQQIESLFTVMADYYALVYQIHFHVKKELLAFIVELEASRHHS
ncbi:M48 family metalloprotease [Pedobacter sp. BAL39]|uniref:M48 family metalloprotease n=1 Tax=Pedobacter sp. BAL39 TaxID=391596 RepID=UPI0002F7844C|nr:M48 family metallopeptidase [Pedobacter sp. BAL39]